MSSPKDTQKTTLVQKTARLILRLIGWEAIVPQSLPLHYVIIGAPHTTNWDFGLALLVMASERISISWVAKESLFRGPVGVLMRAVGAIPVNRQLRTNLVDQVAAKFDEYDELVIGIAPEGTRSKASRWKTGFYYIALKAQVPIFLGFLDYENKVCGYGPSLEPTGNIEADFEIIRDFYINVKGKYPDKQGEISISDT